MATLWPAEGLPTEQLPVNRLTEDRVTQPLAYVVTPAGVSRATYIWHRLFLTHKQVLF